MRIATLTCETWAPTSPWGTNGAVSQTDEHRYGAKGALCPKAAESFIHLSYESTLGRAYYLGWDMRLSAADPSAVLRLFQLYSESAEKTLLQMSLAAANAELFVYNNVADTKWLTTGWSPEAAKWYHIDLKILIPESGESTLGIRIYDEAGELVYELADKAIALGNETVYLWDFGHQTTEANCDLYLDNLAVNDDTGKWDNSWLGNVEAKPGIDHPLTIAVHDGTELHTETRLLIKDGEELGEATIRPAPPDTLVWSDEFEGDVGAAPNAANWVADEYAEEELNDAAWAAANATLDGEGHLQITARKEELLGKSYTSAQLRTRGLRTFAPPARMEARLLLPDVDGLWPAFWAVGTVGEWPEHGEIDVIENYYNADKFSSNIHGGPEHWQAQAIHPEVAGLRGSWHTYGVRWWPDYLEFTLDGEVWLRRSRADMPAGRDWPYGLGKEMYLILDLAVGGEAGEVNDADLPASMLVDWVRVYQ